MLDNELAFKGVVAAAVVAGALWVFLKIRARLRVPRMHPRLQKYGGPDTELARQRRTEAEKIVATSSAGTIAGYHIVRQVEAIIVEGFRAPDEALEGIKALAAMKGANAVINLRHERTTAGRCSASGDAVQVEKADR